MRAFVAAAIMTVPLLAAACTSVAVGPAPDLATTNLAQPFAEYFPATLRDSVRRAVTDAASRCGHLTLWAPDSSVVSRWHIVLDTAAMPARVQVPPTARFGDRGRAWAVALYSTRQETGKLREVGAGWWIVLHGTATDSLGITVGRPDSWLSTTLGPTDTAGRRHGTAGFITDVIAVDLPRPPIAWADNRCDLLEGLSAST
jgi:hypothetical protein